MCKGIAVFSWTHLTFKRKLADPPKYNEMVKQAILSLRKRGGSSRQDMLKYIMKSLSVGPDEKAVNTRLGCLSVLE